MVLIFLTASILSLPNHPPKTESTNRQKEKRPKRRVEVCPGKSGQTLGSTHKRRSKAYSIRERDSRPQSWTQHVCSRSDEGGTTPGLPSPTSLCGTRAIRLCLFP